MCLCAVRVFHSSLPHQQSDSRGADLCRSVGSCGSYLLLADLPHLPVGCLHSETDSVAAESGLRFGLFRSHPERPQRGHGDDGDSIGCPGVRLCPFGRWIFEGL